MVAFMPHSQLFSSKLIVARFTAKGAKLAMSKNWFTMSVRLVKGKVLFWNSSEYLTVG